MTHLTNILNLNMIPSLQFRADNGHLFQSLQELIAEVCQCLDCVTNRGDNGYDKYEECNNTTSSIISVANSPIKRVALSSCRGTVIVGDNTIVISGSILLT